MLCETMYSPDRDSALEEIAISSEGYGARDPKAVETLTRDQDQRLVGPTTALAITCSVHGELVSVP